MSKYLSDFVSGSVVVKSMGDDETEVSVTLFKGSVDGKTKITAFLDGEETKPGASVAAALKSIIKLTYGEDDAKTFAIKEAAEGFKFPEKGSNKGPEDDWKSVEGAADRTNEAKAYAGELEKVEVASFINSRALGKALYALRIGLSNKAFSKWKDDLLADETAPEMLKSLCGEKNVNAFGDYVMLGAMPDDMADLFPASARSPKTVQLHINQVRQAVAGHIVSHAVRMAESDGGAITAGMLDAATRHVFTQGIVAFDAAPLSSLDTKHKRELAKLFCKRHAENVAEVGETRFYAASDDGSIIVLKREDGAYVANAVFATKPGLPDELLMITARAANRSNAEAPKEAEERKAKAEAEENAEAGRVKRSFPEFSTEAAALHLFAILASRYQPDTAPEDASDDVADIIARLGEYDDQVQSGVSVTAILEMISQIETADDEATEGAEDTADAE